MKRSELLKRETCKRPEIESDLVLAVSQILKEDGEDVLNIDLFYEGELKGRYFADATVYNSYVGGKWHTCKMGNVARLCKGQDPLRNDYYYCGGDWKFATKEDEKRAVSCLDSWCISAYEDKINGKKSDRAYDRKRARIDKMMAEVPTCPEDAEKWIKEVLFPDNFLFVEKKEVGVECTCTACGGKSWEKKGRKHGQKIVCQNCGCEVKVNTRQVEKTKSAPVIVLQIVDEDRWAEKQYKVTCRWSRKGKEVELYEELMAIIPKGETWGKVWYGTINGADEFEQEYWDKNTRSKRFMKSYLYPGNLKEVLAYGHLENSGINLLAEETKKFNVNNYITNFHNKPWIEYLAKAGLSRLVSDVVDGYGFYSYPNAIDASAKNLRDALRLDGNRVRRMRDVNGGLKTLEWLQFEAQMGKKITQESLQYLSDKNVSIGECQEILEELGSVNRMVNYMKKQKIAPAKLAITWRDYLRMAANEGMDTTDDIVRLPKNLKARHDHLVELANARADAERMEKDRQKHEEFDRKIERYLPEAARYFWQDDDYMIIPAGKCRELIEEGKALHHCVGASDHYMRKMAEGESWICFLRKKEDLEVPYYTIEIDMKNDTVRQCYSAYDRKPDAQVINGVLKRFTNSAKGKREKMQKKEVA